MTAAVRTWLYAPAHHPDRVRKALASGADAVVIDLEDSVPAHRKDEARAAALQILADLPPERPPVWVRLNAVDTPVGEADVAALAGSVADGFRCPRASDPRVIATVSAAVRRPLQLIIESAAGLLAAPDLARAAPQVEWISLGEADLAADLRTGAAGLDWARGWIVAAARAADLNSPIQSVHTAVGDLEGLRATTALGREHGFFGRSIVHPRQIEVIHDVYTPSSEEITRAEQIVGALQEATERGESTAMTSDGRFVDPAVVAGAQLTLELARLSPRPEAASWPNPSRSRPAQEPI